MTNGLNQDVTPHPRLSVSPFKDTFRHAIDKLSFLEHPNLSKLQELSGFSCPCQIDCKKVVFSSLFRSVRSARASRAHRSREARKRLSASYITNSFWLWVSIMTLIFLTLVFFSLFPQLSSPFLWHSLQTFRSKSPYVARVRKNVTERQQKAKITVEYSHFNMQLEY